ncbi:CREBL2 [Cervus elaphus hippelaphus]|uniref:CREBL2 n=1 Tax=Cervus elaphus hippelaphus TaxID=46360 RepID=A0A212CCQ3_CEREH|nr:CREBL2 [Cervus elaphus hippelaphus]
MDDSKYKQWCMAMDQGKIPSEIKALLTGEEQSKSQQNASRHVKAGKTEANSNSCEYDVQHQEPRNPATAKEKWVDDGVEPVYADGQEHVDLDTRGEILKVAHGPAHGTAQGPAAGGELQQDKRRAGHADQKVSACQGDHKVIGGGLSPPAAVDDQTHQGIAKDRKQPQGPEEDAGCGHFARVRSILWICPVAPPAVLWGELRQVLARQRGGRLCAAVVVKRHQQCRNNQSKTLQMKLKITTTTTTTDVLWGPSSIPSSCSFITRYRLALGQETCLNNDHVILFTKSSFAY